MVLASWLVVPLISSSDDGNDDDAEEEGFSSSSSSSAQHSIARYIYHLAAPFGVTMISIVTIR